MVTLGTFKLHLKFKESKFFQSFIPVFFPDRSLGRKFPHTTAVFVSEANLQQPTCFGKLGF